MKEKKKIILIIFAIIAVGIIVADLILFWTSAQEDGIGRGFSRYWSQEE